MQEGPMVTGRPVLIFIIGGGVKGFGSNWWPVGAAKSGRRNGDYGGCRILDQKAILALSEAKSKTLIQDNLDTANIFAIREYIHLAQRIQGQNGVQKAEGQTLRPICARSMHAMKAIAQLSKFSHCGKQIARKSYRSTIVSRARARIRT
jgi:hypothetical protein